MKFKNKIAYYFKLLPVAREVIRISNIYAYCGKKNGFVTSAPYLKYWDRILYNLYICFSVVYIPFILNHHYHFIKFNDKLDVCNLNLQIFPNLLGFGIGIYALIFMVDSKFIHWLEKHENEEIEPNLINIDLAYPLTVFALITLISGTMSFFQSNAYTKFISCVIFLYGITMVFEMISSIFITVYKKIDDTVIEENQKKDIWKNRH